MTIIYFLLPRDDVMGYESGRSMAMNFFRFSGATTSVPRSWIVLCDLMFGEDTLLRDGVAGARGVVADM